MFEPGSHSFRLALWLLGLTFVFCGGASGDWVLKARSVAKDSQGNLYILFSAVPAEALGRPAVWSDPPGREFPVIQKYLPSGVLDPSYGKKGTVVLDSLPSPLRHHAEAVDMVVTSRGAAILVNWKGHLKPGTWTPSPTLNAGPNHSVHPSDPNYNWTMPYLIGLDHQGDLDRDFGEVSGEFHQGPYSGIRSAAAYPFYFGKGERIVENPRGGLSVLSSRALGLEQMPEMLDRQSDLLLSYRVVVSYFNSRGNVEPPNRAAVEHTADFYRQFRASAVRRNSVVDEYLSSVPGEGNLYSLTEDGEATSYVGANVADRHIFVVETASRAVSPRAFASRVPIPGVETRRVIIPNQSALPAFGAVIVPNHRTVMTFENRFGVTYMGHVDPATGANSGNVNGERILVDFSIHAFPMGLDPASSGRSARALTNGNILVLGMAPNQASTLRVVEVEPNGRHQFTDIADVFQPQQRGFACARILEDAGL